MFLSSMAGHILYGNSQLRDDAVGELSSRFEGKMESDPVKFQSSQKRHRFCTYPLTKK